jgi:hypothetical protein
VTVHEAIHEVRKVGTIRAENGKLKLRFPEPERVRLEPAIDILRHNRESALQTLSTTESDPTRIPPADKWPRSLSELAAEVAQRSNDPQAARREVWMQWCEWKAVALNRLFQEQGTSGEPGRITPAVVRHGELKTRGSDVRTRGGD